MFRRSNVNILHRLRKRQLTSRPPGTTINSVRTLYQCIHPTKASCALEDCQLHVCRFTPCGRFLVAFDSLQHSLVLYLFRGPSHSYRGGEVVPCGVGSGGAARGGTGGATGGAANQPALQPPGVGSGGTNVPSGNVPVGSGGAAAATAAPQARDAGGGGGNGGGGSERGGHVDDARGPQQQQSQQDTQAQQQQAQQAQHGTQAQQQQAQQAPYPGPSQPMSSFFDLHCKLLLTVGGELLCRDFCLVLHGRFLLLASATPPVEAARAAGTAATAEGRPGARTGVGGGAGGTGIGGGGGSSSAAGPPSSSASSSPSSHNPADGLPLVASTTFHLVDMEAGVKVDEFVIRDDLVNLSSQHGVFVHGDLLLVLGVRQQCLYLLQVLPSDAGRLVLVQRMGEHCFADDDLVLRAAQDAEARWQEAHHAAGLGRRKRSSCRNLGQMLTLPLDQKQCSQRGDEAVAGGVGRDEQMDNGISPSQLSSHSPNHTRAPNGRVGGPLSATSAGGRPGQQGHGTNGSGHPSPLPAPSPPPPLPPPSPLLLTGVKQRLLSFLYRKAASGGRQDLQRFHYHFEDYLQLLMLKAQFLDRDHLLISMGTAQHWASRNSDGASPHCSVFCTYRWPSAEVVELHHASDPALVNSYLRHPGQFHTGLGEEPWARYVTPYGCSRHGREQIRRQLQHASWSQAQVLRRVVGALPSGCQAHSPSPYLDANLWQYDDKLISPSCKPRVLTDQPIKFVARRHPDRLKFKVDPAAAVSAAMAAAGTGAGDARMPKHLRFVLHPVLPFMLMLLQGYGVPRVAVAMFYI